MQKGPLVNRYILELEQYEFNRDIYTNTNTHSLSLWYSYLRENKPSWVGSSVLENQTKNQRRSRTRSPTIRSHQPQVLLKEKKKKLKLANFNFTITLLKFNFHSCIPSAILFLNVCVPLNICLRLMGNCPFS